jgi:hypothetical protein
MRSNWIQLLSVSLSLCWLVTIEAERIIIPLSDDDGVPNEDWKHIETTVNALEHVWAKEGEIQEIPIPPRRVHKAKPQEGQIQSPTGELASDDQSIVHSRPAWIVNLPEEYKQSRYSFSSGTLLDSRNNVTAMESMQSILKDRLLRTDGFTDGETVDAIEHYFWGQFDGVAVELGALDGSSASRSMTVDYELFGWKRVIIDGNPGYRKGMRQKSAAALGIIAAICQEEGVVHFSNKEYVGGIYEFMAQPFLKEYHSEIYHAGTPPGDLKTVDWPSMKNTINVDCIPLSLVFKKTKIHHISYFILDVEGGELQVLHSIDWKHTTFDVLCIETEKENRPAGYEDTITAYLDERGYKKNTRQGRNTWYINKNFVPISKPGIAPDCYNGARKSKREDDWFLNRRTPPFTECPLTT